MTKESEQAADQSPVIPAMDQRMPAILLEGAHPSTLPTESLLEQCELRTQRRSGPGGQHRNKTSSGAFLLHRPTEIVAEATERRSQAENREVALSRLRLRLAIERRTSSILDGPIATQEQEIRDQIDGRGLRISARNSAKPAVLALLLNDLLASGGQPSAIAPIWNATTSSVIRFLKTHPPAFVFLNTIRRHHARGPLK